MLHVASTVRPGIETSDGRISRRMAAALARLQEASMLGRKEVQTPATSLAQANGHPSTSRAAQNAPQ
jgi:hypothetical protein